jgi:hypothetical protein
VTIAQISAQIAIRSDHQEWAARLVMVVVIIMMIMATVYLLQLQLNVGSIWARHSQGERTLAGSDLLVNRSPKARLI